MVRMAHALTTSTRRQLTDRWATAAAVSNAVSAVMSGAVTTDPDDRHMPHTTVPSRPTPAVTAPVTSRRTPTMVTRLQTQWEEITQSTASLARARPWFPDADIDSLDDVLTLVGFHGRRVDPESDARLLHLVTLAHTDDLAARVVLQRILPGLVAVAIRRTRYCTGLVHEVFSDLAAAAWLLVRSYPVERRPAKVAVNLLRDAEYQVFVQRRRRLVTRSERITAWVPDTPVPDDDHAGTLVVDALRRARDCGMPDHDLRLLAELASGRHPEQVAASLGCSARTVRNRRAVVTRALRAALVDGIVDWPPVAEHFYDRWEVQARWSRVRAATVPVPA